MAWEAKLAREEENGARLEEERDPATGGSS